MDQVDYIKEKILGEHQFDKCHHPVATPFYGKPLLPPDEQIEDDDPMTQEEYQKLCEKLIWVAFQTRPDISYSVHQACRFLRNAGIPHKDNLRRIVRYLRGSSTLALYFTAEDSGRRKGPPVAADQLSAFVDADWGADPIKGRSTSGWVVFLAGGPVAWGVSLQSIIAQSTTEAEYVALNFCLKDLCWFKQLLEFLGHPQQAIPVLEDNSSALDWAELQAFETRETQVSLEPTVY
jgi:hypothetical protein